MVPTWLRGPLINRHALPGIVCPGHTACHSASRSVTDAALPAFTGSYSVQLSRPVSAAHRRGFVQAVSAAGSEIAKAAQPADTQIIQSSNALSAPDFTFTVEETATLVEVFGCEHCKPQPHIGEYILRTRPHSVVVETALVPEHGTIPGNVMRVTDEIVNPSAAFFLRMFGQIADGLRLAEGEMLSSGLWQQISTNYNGEQLAYVGALTIGANLIFGDRPKDITYRRLLQLTSMRQLDEGFTHQCIVNAREALKLPAIPYHLDGLPVAEQIMMQEREAVMLKVVHDLCQGRLVQVPPLPDAPPPKAVVMVLGNAHLTGLKHLVSSGKWRELVGGADLHASPLMHAPDVVHAGKAPDAGMRRGLLAAMLRLSVDQEVLNDMEAVLGPVPEGHLLAYDALCEIYGCNRMQLSALPPDLLSQLVSGYQCDMYEVLEPMRAIRPINGGPGYSEEMISFVRALNFELG